MNPTPHTLSPRAAGIANLAAITLLLLCAGCKHHQAPPATPSDTSTASQPADASSADASPLGDFFSKTNSASSDSSVSAAERPGDPQASAKTKSGPLQHLPVNDPLFNMIAGTQPFFAGWTGTAAIDRSDPFCQSCAPLALRMTSPDGNSTIQQLNLPLHTALYRPLFSGGHFAQTRFTSAADLLTQYILPMLKLGGQASTPQPFAPAFLANIRQQGASSGVPGVIADTAGVLISGVHPGKEDFVWAITRGTLQGTQAENSTTNVGIVEAPIGQARALAEAYKALPPDPPNQQWAALDQQHTQQVTARSQADANASNTAVQQSISNLNASTARTAANSNATREQIDQQGQNARANARYNSGIQSGNGSTHEWCSTVSQARYTVHNSLNAPDNSGTWRRCD